MDAPLKQNRRTVAQLLAAAAKDTDAASVFWNGSNEGDVDGAVIVIKGREHVQYVFDVLVRQKLVTPGKSVESAAPAAPAVQPNDDATARLFGFIKPDSASHVYFYEQDFYVLSNFSAFHVVWEGLDFDTSEHAYHWEKFATEEDDQTRNGVANAISHASSAHEAFKIAEAQRHLRRPDWDAVKVDVMLNILRAKAEQHEYVRRKLLATGDRTLVEDSWRDDYWGWGPHRDGQNMLGKLWMQVRAELLAKGAA